jgi:hypothetical protein
MLKLALALAAAPLAMTAAAAPAYAADIATITCVEKTLDAATRTQLQQDLEKNLANPQGQQSYAPTTVQGIQKAAKACQAQHGWSDAATMAAILYAVPTVGWPVADRMARAARLDPKKVESRFMALPADERAKAMENPDTFRKVAEGALAAGEVNESNANLAGGLLGLLAVREKGLADFKAN